MLDVISSLSRLIQCLLSFHIQLREIISRDQEKMESIKIQIEDWQTSVQDVESKILETQATLKSLKQVEEQILIKTVIRETLDKDHRNKYVAALNVEYRGHILLKKERNT